MTDKTLDEARATAHDAIGCGETWPHSADLADCTPAHEAIDRLADAERVQRGDAERERMRLAACSVAANGGSLDNMLPEYDSASLRDVVRLRERADGLERKNTELLAALMHLRVGNAAWTVDKERKVADAATRPYREAIARWWLSNQALGGIDKATAYSELRSLISDEDIERARKESA